MHNKLAKTILSLKKGIESSKRPDDRELAAEYLAALAPILASSLLGNDVLAEIKAMDRFFGHTWLNDVEPFRSAFEQWALFREEYRRFILGGMTTNERLFADGQLDAFDRAKATRNLEQLRQILHNVYLDEPSIRMIIESAKQNT